MLEMGAMQYIASNIASHRGFLVKNISSQSVMYFFEEVFFLFLRKSSEFLRRNFEEFFFQKNLFEEFRRIFLSLKNSSKNFSFKKISSKNLRRIFLSSKFLRIINFSFFEIPSKSLKSECNNI